MGKGKSKIEMKLIESLAARNVCFTKRRNGLFKKAFDLCRLFPGVKVAVVVFSPAGNPYVYGDPTGIFESEERMGLMSPESQQQDQQGRRGSPLFPSPLSGENTAWNSGGPLPDEDIESVNFPPQYASPPSVLAGGHFISEPGCYSPIEKETLNTPEIVGWEDDWLITGEDIGSMIRELEPEQGGGPVFPQHSNSSPPSSVQPEILGEEEVDSMIQELLW
ncbi:unnamed protein product [Cuscuta epithymum]|uniref:MADS-box domain-containing protein n=1 Tax=Cuscuta epithymum TaxID=186058 RepID=A0AAV0C3W2_9ASTE|nr:unnamed protein product [Cuscuta epithymum]